MIKEEYKQCCDDGLESELLFKMVAEKRGFTVVKSPDHQDMNDHIDWFIEKNGKRYSVDVKGLKRASRKDKEKDEDVIWVEFRNVEGKPGSLFGKQDFFAYEQNDSFILVRRKDLLDLSFDCLNSFTRIVHKSDYALYNLYTRYGKKDLVTRLKKNNLLEIEHKVWPKNYELN